MNKLTVSEINPMTTGKSLGDLFPKAQARVRCLKEIGASLGPSGAFYVMLCEQALREADEAAISGDVVRMLRAYQAMEDIKA